MNRLTLLATLPMLASTVAAQTATDATLAWPTPTPSPTLAAPSPSGSWAVTWMDDFNRPNAPTLGVDWQQQWGSMQVLSNAGSSTGVTHHWAIHAMATSPYDTASSSVDFLPKTASFNAFYVALVLGNNTSADGIFMKVQDNDGDGLYDRVFFYRGVNGGGWFTGFPNVFDLAIKIPSGRMSCYVTNSGETANIDIDRDFDGIVDEHFEASGLASGGFTGGTQFGLGTFNSPAYDNWTASDMPPAPPYAPYCTAKVNSQGCTPAIAGSGAPSATATSGFTVDVSMVRNGKSGLFFYKVGGTQASTTFQCGTLCVGPSGIRRTPAQSSGGTPPPTNDCSGVYSLDMNAFAAGLAGGNPDPALLVAGGLVHCQTWGRDQGFAAPCNTTLSDGLEYTIGN